MNCVLCIWQPGRVSGGHPVHTEQCQYNGFINQNQIDVFIEGRLNAWIATQGQVPLTLAKTSSGMMPSIHHAFWIGRWSVKSAIQQATVEMIWW